MAMTTSVTRSRRAEGLRHPHPQPISHPPQLIATAKAQNNQHFAANSHRTKRQLDPSSRECDIIVPKKARFTTGIAVEIPTRSSFQSRSVREAREAREASDAKPPQQAPAKPAITSPVLNPTPTPTPTPTPPNPSRAPPPSTTTTTTSIQKNGLTKHQEKVVNGLKHELNRLQPVVPEPKDQGRKLRSAEATRFKSELSAYFPDYDEVIGNDPKEQHILNLDTPILVSSAPPTHHKPALPSNNRQDGSQSYAREGSSVRSYSDALFTDLYDSQTIDFHFLDTRYKGKPLDDPLPDSSFEPSHRKAEKLERSIRNLEKGRAQHEKDQIIRLLDALQGPDWLRVMGVSGITESRKKTFEPAREHFIRGCQAILEKFRLWAAEEKRRKQAKERAMAEAEAEAERLAEEEKNDKAQRSADNESAAEDAEEEDEVEEAEIADSDEEMADADRRAGDNDGDPPDYSDVDASIAKQLQEEARAAAKKSPRKAKRPVPPPPPPPPLPSEPEPYREFKSFFRHKHQRDHALSKNRRRSRNAFAWGLPVPEVAERDFSLPEEFCDEDTLKSHARRKRRDRRRKD
ncbi:something about silencing, SAS, complex subunit 4-domain-containing protein [Bombardia bombarda]|uniref:Something about silencing, SAS, complex subunit 4-domain-containing protein n=1 Tax=Bombardia bombarda TaxID=252184 RepID=A0AA39WMG4_9PEZI|nr:something about silencing, SAS, complex subunit 4-domain-containing protein [Bombardia bombarda]